MIGSLCAVTWTLKVLTVRIAPSIVAAGVTGKLCIIRNIAGLLEQCEPTGPA